MPAQIRVCTYCVLQAYSMSCDGSCAVVLFLRICLSCLSVCLSVCLMIHCNSCMSVADQCHCYTYLRRWLFVQMGQFVDVNFTTVKNPDATAADYTIFQQVGIFDDFGIFPTNASDRCSVSSRANDTAQDWDLVQECTTTKPHPPQCCYQFPVTSPPVSFCVCYSNVSLAMLACCDVGCLLATSIEH